MWPSMISQALPFVHPALAAAGLAAGLIPILIHVLNRWRYRRVRWAAMRFLVDANRRSVRRVRIEQWLLLLTRVALLVLFGAALARPYLASTFSAALGSTGAHHVLFIDNSLSMLARTPTGTRFGDAIAHARAWVDALPRNDAVSLVTLAEPAAAPVDFAALDRRMLLEGLSAIEPTRRSTDLSGAVELAARIFKESPSLPQNRSAMIITDLARGPWSAAGGAGVMPWLKRLGASLDEPASQLVVARVSPSGVSNLAVAALSGEQSVAGGGGHVRLTARVENHGVAAVRGALVEFKRDGELVRRVPLASIEPGSSETVSALVALSRAGTYLIEAAVTNAVADDFSEDDARYLSLEVRESLPVLLVDGRPGRGLLDGRAGYLATAFSPLRVLDRGSGDGSAHASMLVRPRVVAVTALADEAIAEYDVVVLCDVPRLSRQAWSALARFVDRGGGLMVALGPSVQIENYAEEGFAAGVLPLMPERAVELPSRDATTISPERLSHPIVSAFADFPASGIFSARVEGYVSCREEEGRGEVALRFADGAPALVVDQAGRGRVALWTTTVDMTWTNLPAKGDYVSLMLATLGYLAPSRGAERNLFVGDLLREPVSPGETSLAMGVEPAASAVRLERVDDVLALTFGPLAAAGGYRASIGSRVVAFAANVDARESVLEPVETSAFRSALGESGRLRVLSPRSTEGVDALSGVQARAGELAMPLMGVVMALLLLETWMAYLFGSRRAASGEVARS